jgi:hypothetical protein
MPEYDSKCYDHADDIAKVSSPSRQPHPDFHTRRFCCPRGISERYASARACMYVRAGLNLDYVDLTRLDFFRGQLYSALSRSTHAVIPIDSPPYQRNTTIDAIHNKVLFP